MGALVLAQAASGCTLLLDFDKPLEPGTSNDAGTDASAADGSGPTIDASQSPDAAAAANCAAFEPNDDLAAASAITPMAIAAAICPNADTDFYSFALLASTDLTITLDFDNTASDLNLRLYDANGIVVAASLGSEASEVIARTGAQGNTLPGGTYRIEVLSATQDVTLDYSLTLSLMLASAAQ